MARVESAQSQWGWGGDGVRLEGGNAEQCRSDGECGQGPKGHKSVVELGVECGGGGGWGSRRWRKREGGCKKQKNKIRIEPLCEWG